MLALVALVASAAPDSSSVGVKVKKVAVMDVKGVGTFDPKTVQGLSTLVATDAQRFPLKVVSGADLSALIGFEQRKQLLGCSDSSCLAEIGGALGVDFLLTTEVSEVGGIWLITSTVLDVTRASAVTRVTRKASRTADLVNLTSEATSEALQSVVGAPVKAAAEGAQLQAPAPAPASSQRVAGIVLCSAGAATLAGGAISGVLAMTSYQSAKDAADDQAFDDAVGRGKASALAADVLYGVGAAALVVGIVVALTAPSEAVPLAVSPTVTPGGAGLAVAGRF